MASAHKRKRKQQIQQLQNYPAHFFRRQETQETQCYPTRIKNKKQLTQLEQLSFHTNDHE